MRVRQTYLDDERTTLSDSGAGEVTATDARVALRRQQHRQPDGRRVKHGRQVVDETEVGVAPAVRQPVLSLPDREEPDVDRQRPETGQRVGEGDGDQDGVGRRAHVGTEEDDTDEQVADDDDDDQQRHHVAVDERVVRHLVETKRIALGVARSIRRRCLHLRLYSSDQTSISLFSSLTFSTASHIIPIIDSFPLANQFSFSVLLLMLFFVLRFRTADETDYPPAFSAP